MVLTASTCGELPFPPQTDGSAGGQGAGDAGSGPLASCDPLAARPLPIALGPVLAAGQDASGVIFAVDQNGSTQRVFVSDRTGALVRQRVAGSGSGPDFFVFTVTDHDPAFVLQIDMPAGGPLRMGVLVGTLTGSRTFVIGQQGEELAVLPDGAIAGMPVVNLPGTILVEYAARLPDDEVMLVTRPQDDWSYEDFRLYLGSLAAVRERRVSSVSRALDGGSTTIWFDLDGQATQAYFPVVLTDGGLVPGPATMTVAGTTTALVRLPGAPPGAQYLCLP
jgi:hypothetical protein